MPTHHYSTRSQNKSGAAKENKANDASETASAAKPRQSRKKAPNATKTTNKASNTTAKKSGTRKSNRARRKEPQAADSSSLAITLEDLETLHVEDLKRKGRAIYVHLELQNIHDELTDEQVEQVRNYFVDFEEEDFRTLMNERILPGYDEQSKKFITLVNHVQRALFPPADINDLPKHSDRRHSNGKYCGVSLAALYARVCGLDPNPRWKQDTLLHGIELQVESVGRGANRHCSDLSNEQLKHKLINEHNYVRSGVINIKKRLKLLQKLWASQGFPDYTSQEVPPHAPTVDGGGADATHSNRAAAAAFGGDAAGGGGADAAAGAAGGGGAMPSSGSNVIHPETPNPQQSSVGNGGGNDLNTQLLQMMALGFHEHREDQKKRDKERDEEQKQRDKERAEQCKTNADQTKMNAEQTKMNEMLARELMTTKDRVETLETDVGKMRTDVDVLQNGQAEQSRKEAEQDIAIARTAKKADKNAKILKEVKGGLAALGFEMDLSSPESTATNDGEVDFNGDVKPPATTPSNLKVSELTSNMENLDLGQMQSDSPRDDSPPSSLPDGNVKMSCTETPLKPGVGTRENLLSRVLTGAKNSLFGTLSEDSPDKTDSTKDEEKPPALRVQLQRSAPSDNSNASLNQLLQQEEEDSSTDSRSIKGVLFPKTPSKSNVVTSGNYQNAAYSEKKKQSGKREPGTGGDFKTPSRDAFASLDRQRQHEEEDSSTSSDEFVAPSDQESTKEEEIPPARHNQFQASTALEDSNASSNQLLKHEEEEDSSTSSDKFDVFCPECEGYATYVENGGFGQHDWLCGDPNCRNYEKHMSTSNIDAGAGRFLIASSDESVASSDQESSSSVSANQQRKREEGESIASSDQFVCAECKSYESGELQSWNCYDPNCQNNGKEMGRI